MALEDASLEIRQGERLAVVGENGAGKSSLMNVVYGMYRPDSGEMTLRGQKVSFRSPKDAIAQGIGMVHQHFMLVPTLTVAENVVLGAEPKRAGMLDLDRAISDVEALCKRFGFRVDPRARIEDLTVGSRQKVEIVKALHRGAKVLILDEPTAVLTPQEADELFAVTKALSAEGHTVILISHKLKEVLAFADRIAVMRRGRLVAQVEAAQTTPEQLAELMVGTLQPAPAIAPAQGSATPLLEVDGVSAKTDTGVEALSRVSLSVRGGEIVGIAGVDGNGQSELAEVITGLRAASSGALRIAGQPITGHSAAVMREAGVAHIPEDRHRFAMVGPFSVEQNLALGRHRKPGYARGLLIDFASRAKRAEADLEAFDVRPRDGSVAMQRLSGGNQQKVVVARELGMAPRVLVAVQPTRGLDIAAVAHVRRKLTEFARSGGAVLLISLDLEEVMALSDRLYVLFDGEVRAELPRSEFDERRIGQFMLGAEGLQA